MNKYQPFNFGPLLGPLGNFPGTATIIWVESSPLAPGHWELGPPELIGVDEPIGEDPGGIGGSGPSVPIGSGIMSGGGQDLRLLRPGLYVPPKETGSPYKWAKCAGGRDCCSGSQKQRIQDAYKRLVTLPCIVNQFPSLLAEIKNVYKRRVKIRCIPLPCTYEGTNLRIRSYHYFNDNDPNDPANNEIWICASTIDNISDPDDLLSALLHELIHAVGGIELDALAIIQSCWPNKLYDFVDQYNAELTSQGCLRMLSNGKYLIFGRYTAWDPDTGDVASLLQPGNSLDQNRHTVIIGSGDKKWMRSQFWISDVVKNPNTKICLPK